MRQKKTKNSEEWDRTSIVLEGYIVEIVSELFYDRNIWIFKVSKLLNAPLDQQITSKNMPNLEFKRQRVPSKLIQRNKYKYAVVLHDAT